VYFNAQPNLPSVELNLGPVISTPPGDNRDPVAPLPESAGNVCEILSRGNSVGMEGLVEEKNFQVLIVRCQGFVVLAALSRNWSSFASTISRYQKA
jgi:hypothetical protein